MQLRQRIQFVTPYNKVSVGRDDGVSLRVRLANLILSRLIQVVTQIHALYIDGLVSRVIQLYPVVALE